jgi:hypothetical protein
MARIIEKGAMISAQDPKNTNNQTKENVSAALSK